LEPFPFVAEKSKISPLITVIELICTDNFDELEGMIVERRRPRLRIENPLLQYPKVFCDSFAQLGQQQFLEGFR
jgi:hypothetical protein